MIQSHNAITRRAWCGRRRGENRTMAVPFRFKVPSGHRKFGVCQFARLAATTQRFGRGCPDICRCEAGKTPRVQLSVTRVTDGGLVMWKDNSWMRGGPGDSRAGHVNPERHLVNVALIW